MVNISKENRDFKYFIAMNELPTNRKKLVTLVKVQSESLRLYKCEPI